MDRADIARLESPYFESLVSSRSKYAREPSLGALTKLCASFVVLPVSRALMQQHPMPCLESCSAHEAQYDTMTEQSPVAT